MSVNTGDSWSAQCFREDGETESGQAAFRGFAGPASELFISIIIISV